MSQNIRIFKNKLKNVGGLSKKFSTHSTSTRSTTSSSGHYPIGCSADLEPGSKEKGEEKEKIYFLKEQTFDEELAREINKYNNVTAERDDEANRGKEEINKLEKELEQKRKEKIENTKSKHPEEYEKKLIKKDAAYIKNKRRHLHHKIQKKKNQDEKVYKKCLQIINRKHTDLPVDQIDEGSNESKPDSKEEDIMNQVNITHIDTSPLEWTDTESENGSYNSDDEEESIEFEIDEEGEKLEMEQVIEKRKLKAEIESWKEYEICVAEQEIQRKAGEDLKNHLEQMKIKEEVQQVKMAEALRLGELKLKEAAKRIAKEKKRK